MRDIRTPEGIKQVPTCWKEVMLGTYLKIASLKEDEAEEFQALRIIEAYTGIPVLTQKRMQLIELHEITAALEFLNTPMVESPIEQFTIEGETYHVVQNLLVEEAQDYFAIEAIMQEAEQNSLTALPKLLAVVCKRPKESLDTIDINKRQQLFLDRLDVETANNLRVFFYNCGMLYQINSLFYSNRQAIWEAKLTEVKSSLQKLDGTGFYGKWLQKTLRRFLKSYEEIYKTFSSGVPLEQKQSSMKTTFKRLLRRKVAKK